MQMRPIFTIVADLTIDDREAEVLNHICSYDLAIYFREKFSSRFEFEDIKKILTSLRDKTQKILSAKKRAEDTLRPSE